MITFVKDQLIEVIVHYNSILRLDIDDQLKKKVSIHFMIKLFFYSIPNIGLIRHPFPRNYIFTYTKLDSAYFIFVACLVLIHHISNDE